MTNPVKLVHVPFTHEKSSLGRLPGQGATRGGTETIGAGVNVGEGIGISSTNSRASIVIVVAELLPECTTKPGESLTEVTQLTLRSSSVTSMRHN